MGGDKKSFIQESGSFLVQPLHQNGRLGKSDQASHNKWLLPEVYPEPSSMISLDLGHSLVVQASE